MATLPNQLRKPALAQSLLACLLDIRPSASEWFPSGESGSIFDLDVWASRSAHVGRKIPQRAGKLKGAFDFKKSDVGFFHWGFS
jgi:hypothetical protein